MQFDEIVEVVDRGKSADVQSKSTFDNLMISAKTLQKLKNHGFNKPSPVQEKAIPLGLIGKDMLVQAKSGTGKTLVFSVLAVETIDVGRPFQKMIIAPTREIALQIQDTVRKLLPQGCSSATFVGGTSLNDDISEAKRGPQIVIGTPGRLCQLVSKAVIRVNSVDLLILDEADKLMEASFQEDINFLLSGLPPLHQMVVLSATYPTKIDETLAKYMRDAAFVRFNSDDVQLIGIKQYVILNAAPIDNTLANLLRSVQFSQAIVFCDMSEKCEPICSKLLEQGFTATFISGQMPQKERENAIEQLKKYKVKILVSSDLTARGIDADRVNLVINVDNTINSETYFHRIGRAARYGGQGAAITLLEDSQAARCFTAMAHAGKINARRVEIENIPHDVTSNTKFFDSCQPFLQAKKSVENVDEDIVEGSQVEENNDVVKHTPVVKKTFQDRLKAFHAVNDELKQKKITTTKEEEAPKPKFKFVPTRQKAKRKFYMRGEMLSIRDSVTEEQWKLYASTKFDLTAEPFTIEAPKEEPKEQKKNIPKKSEKPVEVKSKPKPPPPNVKSYTRKQMIGIQMKVPKEAWIPYVKSKHDTSEDPWELDPYLRCSFTDRLRRVRDREKAERKKVMEEQKRIKEKEPVLMSSARTPNTSSIDVSNMKGYQNHIEALTSALMVDYKEDEKEASGPVVSLRRAPAIWKSAVTSLASQLRALDNAYDYQIALSMGLTKESASQNDREPCSTDTLSSLLNTLTVAESEEEVTSQKLSNTTTTATSTSREVIAAPEVIDPTETSEVEPSEVEIVCYDGAYVARDGTEEQYDEEGEGAGEQDEDEAEVEQDEDEAGEVQQDEESTYERIQNFAEDYRRKVDFNTVFGSYFKFMSESMRK